MGRPPKGGNDKLAGRLDLRVTAGEKASCDEAARKAGMERSDWIRDILNKAAKRALKKDRPPP